jgi:hypothetical protein
VNNAVQRLLSKAQSNIEAAKLLLDKGFTEVAITRAYYAMFYCAQALLLEKGITGSSHKRVISAFGPVLAGLDQACRNILGKCGRSVRQMEAFPIVSSLDNRVHLPLSPVGLATRRPWRPLQPISWSAG